MNFFSVCSAEVLMVANTAKELVRAKLRVF